MYSLLISFQKIWQLCLSDLTTVLFLKTVILQRPISNGGRTEYRRLETRVPGFGLDHLTFNMGIFSFTGLEVGTWTIIFYYGGKKSNEAVCLNHSGFLGVETVLECSINTESGVLADTH